MIECRFAEVHLNYVKCSLGFYGGRPSHGLCQQCIDRGENTLEFALELAERENKAHPEGAPRISGCCDRADQD